MYIHTFFYWQDRYTCMHIYIYIHIKKLYFHYKEKYMVQWQKFPLVGPVHIELERETSSTLN